MDKWVLLLALLAALASLLTVIAQRRGPVDVQREIGRMSGAIEERRRLEESTNQTIRRIESVIGGSFGRGRTGENLLALSLSAFPKEMVGRDLVVGGRVCEFALKMSDGKWLPIDSKWAGTDLVEMPEGRKIAEKAVGARIREVSGYIDPSLTVSMAVLALPDEVYESCRSAHAAAAASRVVLVPYSSAVPILLTMWNLHRTYSRRVDDEAMLVRLHELSVCISELSDRIEGHLSRGLIQATNAVGAIRGLVAAAQTSLDLIAPAEATELREVERKAEAV